MEKRQARSFNFLVPDIGLEEFSNPGQGCWFFQGTPFSPPKKNCCHDITEILLKMVLNTITLPSNPNGNLYLLTEKKKVLFAILMTGGN
jgi:hypothetical protein